MRYLVKKLTGTESFAAKEYYFDISFPSRSYREIDSSEIIAEFDTLEEAKAYVEKQKIEVKLVQEKTTELPQWSVTDYEIETDDKNDNTVWFKLWNVACGTLVCELCAMPISECVDNFKISKDFHKPIIDILYFESFLEPFFNYIEVKIHEDLQTILKNRIPKGSIDSEVWNKLIRIVLEDISPTLIWKDAINFEVKEGGWNS